MVVMDLDYIEQWRRYAMNINWPIMVKWAKKQAYIGHNRRKHGTNMPANQVR